MEDFMQKQKVKGSQETLIENDAPSMNNSSDMTRIVPQHTQQSGISDLDNGSPIIEGDLNPQAKSLSECYEIQERKRGDNEYDGVSTTCPLLKELDKMFDTSRGLWFDGTRDIFKQTLLNGLATVGNVFYLRSCLPGNDERASKSLNVFFQNLAEIFTGVYYNKRVHRRNSSQYKSVYNNVRRLITLFTTGSGLEDSNKRHLIRKVIERWFESGQEYINNNKEENMKAIVINKSADILSYLYKFCEEPNNVPAQEQVSVQAQEQVSVQAQEERKAMECNFFRKIYYDVLPDAESCDNDPVKEFIIEGFKYMKKEYKYSDEFNEVANQFRDATKGAKFNEPLGVKMSSKRKIVFVLLSLSNEALCQLNESENESENESYFSEQNLKDSFRRVFSGGTLDYEKALAEFDKFDTEENDKSKGEYDLIYQLDDDHTLKFKKRVKYSL